MKLATHASLDFWDDLPAAQRARTLALDRFASFPLEKQNGRYNVDRGNTGYRRETCDAVAGGAVLGDSTSAWLQFLREGLRLPDDQLLFGQLQSRLMVNMAGGVLENGGLCLDRRTGLPYIPGSAVKGCARRMAIQQLLETREAGKSAQELAGLLVEIALTFGWGDTDWKAGRKPGKNGRKGELHSDFEFACGEDESWLAVRDIAAVSLLERLGVKHCGDPEEPWKDLPNFAGSVSFLPAYPVDVAGAELPMRPPALGKLELDVVTCHHGKYYNEDPDYASAPDTEDPVPVVFPAVAPAHVFAFATLPLRGCPPELVAKARTWLAEGLATFGLGAKTSVGYGWFADVGQQVMPWWRLQVAVARLKAKHRGFAAYADALKDEVVLNLSEQPAVCKAWSESDPTSFEPIKQYSASQGIQLV